MTNLSPSEREAVASDVLATADQGCARRMLLAAIAGCGCGREAASSYLELRFRRPGESMHQSFHECADVAAVSARAAVLAAENDVYVGAAPRVRRFGGVDAIERVHCLWADLDDPDAVDALASFQPQPSLVIASGSPSSSHAWWVLNEALSPAHARVALRRLAHRLGADMAAAEPARILRPPGTRNHKHDPPAAVTCTHVQLDSWPAREIVGGLPDPPERPARPAPAAPPVRDTADALRSFTAEEYIRALTGRDAGRDAKVQCPFHGGGQERTPSMQLYGDTWACFACPPLRPDRDHAGGDIYTFAGVLYDLDPRDAEQFKALRRRLATELLADHHKAAA